MTTLTAPSVPPVAPRLWPALGGVWRLTWRRVFAPSRSITGGLAVAGLGLFTYRFARQQDLATFVDWANSFVLGVVLAIMAFLGGASAVRELLKLGAVDYLSTRSVPRPMLVLFSYLSQVGCGLIAGAMVIGGVFVIGRLAGQDQLAAELPRQLLLMTMAVLAFTALGLGMGALTRRYMLLGLAYAGLIEAALGNIPIQINKLSISRHLYVLQGDGAGSPILWDAATWTALGLMVAISTALVAVAVAVFSRMEFLGAREKES